MTVTEKAPGKWQACADWGRGEDGRRVRTYRTMEGPTTEADAMRAALAWAARSAPPEGIRALLDAYVDAKEANGAAAQTVRLYRGFARRAALALPDVPPADLTTAMVSDALHAMLAHGAVNGGPLSRATVSRVYWFMCGAFDWARDVRGAVADNPVRPADHPQPERREAVPLDPADVARLSAWCRDALGHGDAAERATAAAAMLGLRAGLRVGEACGLRWRDVDTARNVLTVRGTVIEAGGPPRRQPHTKTAAGMRNVTVDSTLGAALAGLRAGAEAMGAAGPDAPIVTEAGAWARPSAVSRRFGALARRLGLASGVSFHSLRHTFATYQLRAGVPIKTVSARLGHQKIETTLAVYGHVLAGDDAAAAAMLERAYRDAASAADAGGGLAARTP